MTIFWWILKFFISLSLCLPWKHKGKYRQCWVGLAISSWILILIQMSFFFAPLLFIRRHPGQIGAIRSQSPLRNSKVGWMSKWTLFSIHAQNTKLINDWWGIFIMKTSWLCEDKFRLRVSWKMLGMTHHVLNTPNDCFYTLFFSHYCSQITVKSLFFFKFFVVMRNVVP